MLRGKQRVGASEQIVLKSGWRTLLHGDLIHARIDAIEPMPPCLEPGEEAKKGMGEPRLIHNAKTSVYGAEFFSRHNETERANYNLAVKQFISNVHPDSPARAVCSGDIGKVIDGYNRAHGVKGDRSAIDALEKEAKTLITFINQQK